MAQICTPSIGLIDGIIGEKYHEWGGDPVSSGILIAGNNLVATDAVGARFMGVDPQHPLEHLHLFGLKTISNLPTMRISFIFFGNNHNRKYAYGTETIFCHRWNRMGIFSQWQGIKSKLEKMLNGFLRTGSIYPRVPE